MTQKDIANKLNLSRSLVAGVLNNKPGVWASEETRSRIHLAAREMNYRPHAAARALRSGKTRTMSFHELRLPEHNLPSHSIVIESLAQFADSFDNRLAVNILSSCERFRNSLDEIATSHSSDLAVLWGPEDVVGEGAELLEQYGMPFVLKGFFDASHPHWPQIDFDHFRMMSASVECLKSLGHQRIAYFGHDTDHTYAVRLREGFVRAIQEYFGRLPNPEWMIRTGYNKEISSSIRTWLELPVSERPSAFVMGTNDEGSWQDLEVQLARHRRRLGIGPDDLSAAGLRYYRTPLLFGQAYAFSGTDLGELMRVMCTSLIAPLLAGQVPAKPVIRILPDFELVESLDLFDLCLAGCPARGDFLAGSTQLSSHGRGAACLQQREDSKVIA